MDGRARAATNISDRVKLRKRKELAGITAGVRNFPSIIKDPLIRNAVVVKPSRPTSQSTVLLGRLATDVGLPDGILNVVTGNGPDVGAALAEHPDVRRIAFTGSVETGRVLARQAAGRLIPVTLELGGKSPIILFADADLERAVGTAVRSWS